MDHLTMMQYIQLHNKNESRSLLCKLLKLHPLHAMITIILLHVHFDIDTCTYVAVYSF